MLHTATTSKSLFGSVCDLLAVSEQKGDGSQRGEPRDDLVAVLEQSEEIAIAAFDLEGPEALETAHRTLYALYADRVWRAPSEPRQANLQSTLDRVRANLEHGFRGYLALRLRAARIAEPDRDNLEAWFIDLATGPHPLEDPEWADFIREHITLQQLREIVANRSLFFLREPDPWIYAVPTLRGVAKAGLIDLLLDEYGWGKLDRMHSSVYARLMSALALEPAIDHFESVAEWRYLATLNHQWMLALTPECSRRLLGTIYLTEADSPGSMSNYLRAWERLGVSDPNVLEFYEIHVTADENHKDIALHEVVLPVCAEQPEAAGDIAAGIFDARTLEAEFAAGLAMRFQAPAATAA
jgi:hypothetical protein